MDDAVPCTGCYIQELGEKRIEENMETQTEKETTETVETNPARMTDEVILSEYKALLANAKRMTGSEERALDMLSRGEYAGQILAEARKRNLIS